MAKKPISEDLSAARKRYRQFLQRNPEAVLNEIKLTSGSRHRVIENPWGDGSVAFLIPDHDTQLAKALNSVRLPPRFTALYHYDTRQLEVIWTAFKLDEEQQKVVGRAFELRLNAKSYDCAFKESSKRLLTIAEHSLPLQVSETEFRNLRSFNSYATRDEADDEVIIAVDKPLSFWIGKVDFDEDELTKLIAKINFYMKQYDFSSPVVVIHPPKDELSVNPRTRSFGTNSRKL